MCAYLRLLREIHGLGCLSVDISSKMNVFISSDVIVAGQRHRHRTTNLREMLVISVYGRAYIIILIKDRNSLKLPKAGIREKFMKLEPRSYYGKIQYFKLWCLVLESRSRLDVRLIPIIIPYPKQQKKQTNERKETTQHKKPRAQFRNFLHQIYQPSSKHIHLVTHTNILTYLSSSSKF